MNSIRIIPRLDLKGPNLIKGVHLEGLRVIGTPNSFALKYYQEGADELIFMDIVASLYGRNSLLEIIESASKDVFIPMTVGGGIRTLEDATSILRAGADKVAINTAGVLDPKLLSQIANAFGSSTVVSSIEAKQTGEKRWEVYTYSGREKTGLDVIEWAKICEYHGVGEVLITSIDNEGTRKGFDLKLVSAVSSVLSIPVIASGGMGKPIDVVKVAKIGHAQGVAMADILHYGKSSIHEIKATALAHDIAVRIL